MDLTTLAATITALGVVFGAIFAVHKWFLKQEKQDKDIKAIKEEQTVLVHGVLACLMGLKEQGCNGPVPPQDNAPHPRGMIHRLSGTVLP